MTNEFECCIMVEPLREWRNRQTRTFEGRVSSTYGFKSRLPHQQEASRKTCFFVFAGIETSHHRYGGLTSHGTWTGSRRLENIVVARRSIHSLLQLLIFFGRVIKNSYQLFFPRLPVYRTNKKQVARLAFLFSVRRDGRRTRIARQTRTKNLHFALAEQRSPCSHYASAV